MATYSNNYLLVQPSDGATQTAANNHRKLFIDSTGRYWYIGFTQEVTEPILSKAASIDIWYADDPEGSWTKEILRLPAEYGATGASALTCCFAEAVNGDIVVWVAMDSTTHGASDAWRIYRRIGDDVTPNWTQQA